MQEQLLEQGDTQLRMNRFSDVLITFEYSFQLDTREVKGYVGRNLATTYWLFRKVILLPNPSSLLHMSSG